MLRADFMLYSLVVSVMLCGVWSGCGIRLVV